MGFNDLIQQNTFVTNTGPSLEVDNGIGNQIDSNVLDSLVVAGGELAVIGPSPVTTVALSGGTLDGSDVLTVYASMTWSGGIQAGSGSTVITSGATLSLAATSDMIDNGRAIDDKGITTWATAGNLRLDGGAVFTNDFGASFTASGSGGLGSASGGGTFINYDTFQEIGNSSSATFAALLTFYNYGTVSVQTSAVLALTGNYTQLHNNGAATKVTNGSLTVSGALIEQAGQINMTAATIQVGGGMQLWADAALSGSDTIIADLTNDGQIYVGGAGTIGTLHLKANATAGIHGNFTQSSYGSLNMDIAGPSSFDLLQIDGLATLDGGLGVFLLNSYVPSSGQTFNLITYGSRSGTFANIFSSVSFVAKYDTPPGTFCLQAV
jgi:hypothetical protein